MPAMFADRTRHIDASRDKPDELQRALDVPAVNWQCGGLMKMTRA